MAKELLGDACACVKQGAKNSYIKMGVAFKDGERISIKIDALPLPSAEWEGWINIFPRKAATPATNTKAPSNWDDDDIPF
jgi:hypothetical protein